MEATTVALTMFPPAAMIRRSALWDGGGDRIGSTIHKAKRHPGSLELPTTTTLKFSSVPLG
jgi:hypothetical protein